MHACDPVEPGRGVPGLPAVRHREALSGEPFRSPRQKRLRGRRGRPGGRHLRQPRGTGAHMIDAVIISTGDELTTGRTTDTNAGFIADRLLGLGIDVVAVLTVGDRQDRLRWAWREALKLARVVIA